MNTAQGYGDEITRDESEIIRAETRLAEAVNVLSNTIEHLDKRVGHILRPGEAIDAEAERRLEVRESTAPMTDFLVAQAARIEAVNARLTDMLYRIAL